MTNSGTIKLSRIHYPVNSLGPGTRIGIWLQGCSLACNGCMSKHTWDIQAGNSYLIENIISRVESTYLTESPQFNGITFSGGEPFEQGNAFLSLVRHIKNWRDNTDKQLDLLCYSGFRWATIKKRFPEALELFDGIISEPYSQNKKNNSAIMGSSNQILHRLTSLGEKIYSLEWQNLSERKIDIVVDKNSISVIGIPNQGDLNKLVNLCEAKGLSLEGVSWS